MGASGEKPMKNTRLWKAVHPHVKAVKLYYRSFAPLDALKAVALHLRGMVTGMKGEMTVSRKRDWLHPPILRIPADDVFMYNQIFNKRDYGMTVKEPPSVIVDAGANIGSASIWFASRFPDAAIIAIEPETGNFDLLCRNVKDYPNITPVQAVLWDKESQLSIIAQPGFGEAGFVMTGDGGKIPPGARVVQEIRALTIPAIMREYGLDHIDILKIDIEGSEKEVFESASPWIDQVETLIAELHERFKPGCNTAFESIAAGFSHRWTRGENIFLSRGNCRP
jgi:FkbM family methyltransferase